MAEAQAEKQCHQLIILLYRKTRSGPNGYRRPEREWAVPVGTRHEEWFELRMSGRSE